MARTVRNAKLDTRTARAKLPPRKSPYWTSLSRGRSIGYRRGKKSGIWLAKLIDASGRREKRLGIADDTLDADGASVFSHAQAQELARSWFIAETAGPVKNATSYTVGDALSSYLNWMEAEQKKSLAEFRYEIAANIRPQLGDRLARELTPDAIRGWHQSLAKLPAKLRSRRGGKVNSRPAKDEDAQRKRRVTANRNLAILRAALNHAWRESLIESDDAWRRVQPFKNVEVARARWLEIDECEKLVRACPPDFRQLVLGALFTGARYGELTRLRVEDYDHTTRLLHVRNSKSGKPRHVNLTDQGAEYFRTLTKDRDPAAHMFVKANGQAWGKSHQVDPLRQASKAAGINPAVNFHAIRHSYASHAIMNGAPMAVIAKNLGHADTRMVDRHYGHLSDKYMAKVIRATAPTLSIDERF